MFENGGAAKFTELDKGVSEHVFLVLNDVNVFEWKELPYPAPLVSIV